jgi:hypothetical protein
MSEQIAVKLVGVADNRTGEGWVYVFGLTESHRLYATAAEARRAALRALRRVTDGR